MESLMKNNWLGYTNKMLFHSRLLIDAFNRASDLEKPAFYEACLNTMVQAYRSLLAEIIANYLPNINQLPTLNEAIRLVNSEKREVNEIQYIERLEGENSWLSALLKSHLAEFGTNSVC